MKNKKTVVLFLGALIFFVGIYIHKKLALQPVITNELLEVDLEAVNHNRKTSTLEKSLPKESLNGLPSYGMSFEEQNAPGEGYSVITYGQIIDADDDYNQFSYLRLNNLSSTDLDVPYNLSIKQVYNDSDDFFLVVENLLTGEITSIDLKGIVDLRAFTHKWSNEYVGIEKTISSSRIGDRTIYVIVLGKEIFKIKFDDLKENSFEVIPFDSTIFNTFKELNSGIKKININNHSSLLLETNNNAFYYYYPSSNTLISEATFKAGLSNPPEKKRKQVVYEKTYITIKNEFLNYIYRGKSDENDYIPFENQIYDAELITANPIYSLLSYNDTYALLLQINDRSIENEKYKLSRYRLDKKVIDWQMNIDYQPNVSVFKKGFVVYPEYRNSEDTKRLYILNEGESLAF
ncbi:hypothetical protein [Thorsellia anophelis]|uniref:Uncharacterized protein n=1 Tax=Thorsellia anophelis DSM 18579 TaxID=1123402 RepID=A0A1H9ZN49_9GAMM|nr:hypothetical protein [Thorsellia anophelis]SES83058.1 hypothetical protein SAMN02583745_00614 [Thorsellia anophelis DSM 18579]